jgi:hypothetical protein
MSTPNGQPPPQPNAAQQLAQVQQACFNRGRIHFGELSDALIYTCIAAEQGDPNARTELQQFLQTLERCRTAAKGIASGQGVHILPPRG